MFQPRNAVGHFDTTGTTPHEKHRFHSQAAHIERVSAQIARYNGETSKAETHEAAAATHDRLASGHLAAALKP
jgi:hypothetical protein